MPDQSNKVLIVDDDPFFRKMLPAKLRSMKFQSETAENGYEGLEKFRQSQDIALIISDLNMPEMNGMEFLEHVRELNQEIPVIVLTGDKEISIALEAISKGANDYVLKDGNIMKTVPISVKRVMVAELLKKQNRDLKARLEKKDAQLQAAFEKISELTRKLQDG